jgi:hypothetical protein
MKMNNLGSKRPTPNVFDDTSPNCNKSRSVVHEDRLQKVLRSKTTPNSGALAEISYKGDLQDGLFVWQAKLTDKSRFTITSDVLVELQRQASLNSKWAGVALTLEGLPDHLEKDWVMIPASVFGEIIDIYKTTYK